MKNTLLLKQAQENWDRIAQYKVPEDINLEVNLYRKLLSFFQVGSYYYLIFNTSEGVFEYVDQSVDDLLGYDAEEFTLEKLLENIHPNDLPYFLDFEATVTSFFGELSPEKVLKYKVRYDYRIKCADGKYKRILQQVVTIQSDKEGAVLRTFVIHTDISHLKTSNKMILSIIGLDGEPSYYNVKPKRKFSKSKEIFSPREKEVLVLLINGKTSQEIAKDLYISKHTVSVHRKNILRKSNTHTILALANRAFEKGWV